MIHTIPYHGLDPLIGRYTSLCYNVKLYVEPSLDSLTFVNSKRAAANLRGNYAIKAFAGVDTSDEELDAI